MKCKTCKIRESVGLYTYSDGKYIQINDIENPPPINYDDSLNKSNEN